MFRPGYVMPIYAKSLVELPWVLKQLDLRYGTADTKEPKKKNGEYAIRLILKYLSKHKQSTCEEIAEDESNKIVFIIEKIIFNPGLMLSLEVRKKLAEDKIESKIGALIDASYQGWLLQDTNKNNNGFWQQSYTLYDGFGTISDNSNTFVIEALSNFVPETNELGLLGTIKLKITRNGQSVLLPRFTENGIESALNLDCVKALVFPGDINLDSRFLRGPENCNMLHPV